MVDVLRGPLPPVATGTGHWPSFRGAEASGAAEKQNLPDTWNPVTGEHVLWKTPIPGLAHSSPIVWGDTIFVTSAISSRTDATFKPGLYGDGDASDDRSAHRWMLYAIDKHSGKILWERVAFEGAPRNKRHIKSTYASASPATDGRIVVAWFGSQGVHAMRDIIARKVFKMDTAKLRVITPDVGGGFGPKGFVYREYPLLLEAARRIGKPVKWVSDRTEHFLVDATVAAVLVCRLAYDEEADQVAVDHVELCP